VKYGDAFKLFFRDANWVHNAMVAVVFLIIPLVGPGSMLGWHCEIARRLVRHGRGEAVDGVIPRLEFADLVRWLERGITPFIAQMIASFPVSIVGGMLSAFAMVLVSIGAANRAMGLVIVGGVLFALGLLALIVLSMAVVNAFVTRAELTGDLSKTLDVSAVWSYLKATFWPAVLANVVVLLIAIPLSLLGLIACFVGMFVVSVAIGVASVSIRVQIYQRYLEAGGEEIPLGNVDKPGIFSGGGL